MSAHEKEPVSGNGDGQGQTMTEKPEVTEEHKKIAHEMMKAYEERPTKVLPGTGNTVAGTAVGEWLDDEGNPKNEEYDPKSEENEPT